MGFIANIKREAHFVSQAARTLSRIKSATKGEERTVADAIEESVDRHAERTAFIFEGESWTYAEFDAYANRVANWAAGLGLRRGDSVALFIRNRLEYVAIWYGLTKVGVIAALVNNQLTGQGLAHCVNIARAQHVITEPALADAIASAQEHFDPAPQFWCLDHAQDDTRDFGAALQEVSDARPPHEARAGLGIADTALMIYTSGTTGLPKAARISNYRAITFLNVFSVASGADENDRVLLVLPLYHATGGVCGVGLALTNGGAIILEERFSASRFWDVACENDATAFMYVGELCRFLTAAEPHPKERAHNIRFGVGNGLRPDVWERFQERFNIPHIVEFYGATEGNVSFINTEGAPGAIGRLPSYAKPLFNARLVKFDVENEQVVRGEDGLCIEAAPGEVGEALGQIKADNQRSQFDGYQGADEETERKILRDVFQKGDAWFRTGDLMRFDEDGYYYFVDRIGDTFRWRSENVATSEVAEAITIFDGVSQANVYGVPVPGYDGKAGMAAIVADPGIDLAALRAHLERELPAYARPLFMRLQSDHASHATGTFKLRKVELVEEGFNPDRVNEPLFFDDQREGAYVNVDAALCADIIEGRIRL